MKLPSRHSQFERFAPLKPPWGSGDVREILPRVFLHMHGSYIIIGNLPTITMMYARSGQRKDCSNLVGREF